MPVEQPIPRTAVHLEIRDPQGRRQVPLSGTTTRLGRAAENDVQVSDGRVSKRHAEIVCRDGRYVLCDVGSKAGVFCNGAVVNERELRDGDVILLGKACTTSIVFRAAGAEDAAKHDSVFLSAFSDTSLYVPPGAPDAAGPASSGGQSRLQSLARFLDLSRTLSGRLSSTEVVEAVVDMAIEITKAERGFVVLFGDDGGLRLVAMRGRGGKPLAAAPTISETLVREVLETKAPKVVSDVALDAGLAAAQSVMNLRLRAVAALPLRRHAMPIPGQSVRATDEVFGVLCLDSQQARRAFDAVDLGILESLARDASAAIENARLMREAEEKQRLEEELARAKEVQSALVPKDYWSASHFDVAGSFVPCLDLGGDYLGQFRRPGGVASFVVADVCGKGMHAALLAAALQGGLMVEFGTGHTLAEVVTNANRLIAQVAPLGKFISMVCCSLSPDGVLTYVNAGHCPLILVRDGAVEQLVTGGIALGLDDTADYEEHELQMHPGDTVILYTDGILEAMNRDREPFGDARLEQAVAGCHGKPAQATLRALLEAVAAFCGETAADDDTTLMVVTYRGAGPA